MMLTMGQIFAQDAITVNATTYDISDNLDLEAVAYLFGEAKNLEEFERMLNDPEKRISNLDLNNDGYIDYLRVIEVKNDGVFIVTIQAVLGQDLYQDVATIDVEMQKKKKVYVQVVGNPYIYGTNYIIEPVYVHRPLIYDFFWYPRHAVWYSPYYWSYYPVYYSYRKPHAVHVYHHHVYTNYSHHMNCHYVHYRKNHYAEAMNKKVQRNDYEKSNPNQSFNQRNNGVENRKELTSRRSSVPNSSPVNTTTKAAELNKRQVQSDWKSTSPDSRSSQRSSNKTVTIPANQTRAKSAPVGNENRNVRTESSSDNRREERSVSRPENVKSTSGNAPEKTSKPTYTQPQNRERANSAPSQKPATSSVNRTSRDNGSSESRVGSSSQKPAAPSRPEARKTENTQRSNAGYSVKSTESKSKSVGSNASKTNEKKSSTTNRSSSSKPSEKSKSESRR